MHMTPFAISGLFIAVSCIGVGLLVSFHQPKQKPLNTYFILFELTVSLWGTTSFLGGINLGPDIALWVWKFAHVSITLIPVFCYQTVYSLCDLKNKKVLKLVYIQALVWLCVLPSNILMNGVRFLFDSYYYPRNGPVYLVYVACWLSVVVIAHYELWRKYLLVKGFERKNLTLFFLANSLAFLGGMTNFFPVFGINVYPWGNFLIPIFPLVTGYAIYAYRFMAIQVAITKTGILLGTYLVVLGIPFVVGWKLRPQLELWLQHQWWLIPLGLCTALATIGPFAYAYFQRQAESRLLRDQRRYQRTLQLAARGMTQVRDIQHLSKLITRLVSRTVRVTHASLFLWDANQQRYVLRSSHGSKRLAPETRYGLEETHPLITWLKEHRQVLSEDALFRYPNRLVSQELLSLEAAIVIPGFFSKNLIGLLVLGPRRSGAEYSPDDFHAFSTLAHEAAIALENASSYEELMKANEQLKAASERLVLQERLAAAGQFATGVAHEIKNPLSAIKTFAQYLPEKYNDPAFREKFFRIVQSEIDRINQIVNDLSDFAKPSPPQLQPVRLRDVVEDTISLLSDQCLKHGIEVHNHLSGDGATVQADPQQLKQVVLNLALNSLDAMPQGGRLEVRTASDQGWVTLRISDTGAGIPIHEQHKIWDPFFTTKERGMGLGLAMVRGIVERHGGRITLSSALGKGTSVEVVLPVVV